jgi:hypothetical protein
MSLLMPPKHKGRKKVARTVPAKAKREGSQQGSSLMVPAMRSDRGKPKKNQKPICYWGGCTTPAQRWGVCALHGGRYPCLQEGCGQKAVSDGYCKSHGGGTKCKVEGCTTVAATKNLCWKHGGGTRCSEAGCEKQANYDGTLPRSWGHQGLQGERLHHSGKAVRPMLQVWGLQGLQGERLR